MQEEGKGREPRGGMEMNRGESKDISQKISQKINPVDEKLAFVYSTFDLLSNRQRRKAR